MSSIPQFSENRTIDFEEKRALKQGHRVPKDTESQKSSVPAAIISLPNVKKVGQGVPKDTRPRPWVKSRFSPDDIDAVQIFEGWVEGNAGCTKLAQAIRLFDAIEREDTDYIRKNHPALGARLGNPPKPRKNKTASPVLNSIINDSKDIKNQKEGDALELAVVEVCKIDPDINRRTLDKTLFKLRSASKPYTGDEVRDWCNRVWFVQFPGNVRHEPPSLKQLEERIMQVKELSPLSSTSIHAPSEETEPDIYEPIPAPPPAVYDSAWAGAMGAYQIQLTKATYANWLKGLILVETRKEDHQVTYVIAAPNRYVIDWITRNIDLARQLNRYRSDKKESVIVLEDESCYNQ